MYMFMFLKKKGGVHRASYYLVTGFGMVVFWRGIWGLLDIYLFPNQPLASYAISAFVGVLILFLNDYSLSEMGE